MSLAACGSGAGGSGEDVIKVAVLDAQSGKFSDFGIDVERGARMAFDEINEAGGVTVGGKTYKFKYEITDLQSDPTVAAQAAQQAVSGGTKILIGATVSALTEPITGVVQRSGGQVLQIGMATSLDRHVGKKDPIFRTLPSDEVMAKQYIPVLRKEFPDVKTIGSLMINDAVGQSILKIYTPLFEENGFKVASQDTFPSDETNFAPLLQRSAKDAQAFFVGYTDPVGKAVVNAALEAGKAKIFFNRGSVCQVGMEFGDKIDAFACQIVGDDPVKPSSDEAKAVVREVRARVQDQAQRQRRLRDLLLRHRLPAEAGAGEGRDRRRRPEDRRRAARCAVQGHLRDRVRRVRPEHHQDQGRHRPQGRTLRPRRRSALLTGSSRGRGARPPRPAAPVRRTDR